MEIKINTKFNVGNEVFFIDQNKLCKGTVHKIIIKSEITKIEVDKITSEFTKKIAADKITYEIRIRSKLSGYTIREEKGLFKSAEDLIKSLEKSFLSLF